MGRSRLFLVISTPGSALRWTVGSKSRSLPKNVTSSLALSSLMHAGHPINYLMASSVGGDIGGITCRVTCRTPATSIRGRTRRERPEDDHAVEVAIGTDPYGVEEEVEEVRRGAAVRSEWLYFLTRG